MNRLSPYRAKRDFKLTKEPRGRASRKDRHRFVVQRHDATRLHYDLRLELDGVYKSWAVTKTPSLDPAVKRLAVEVEDHPIEYGTFEGTIPAGQYGGGTVQLWDRGFWRPQSDDPENDLEKGHLKITINGRRLKGKWALVRMRDRQVRSGKKIRHNWLLIKETDEEARRGKAGDSLAEEVTSVKTGRTLDEIAQNSRKVWTSKRPTKISTGRLRGSKKRDDGAEQSTPRRSKKNTPAQSQRAARRSPTSSLRNLRV